MIPWGGSARTLLRSPNRADIFNLMDWTNRLAGLALATLLPAVAGASAPKGMVEVREEILENGLKVLLLENHRSPAVTFQVWYRVGSRNEVDGKSGMAHFLEHMLFKGTEKVAPEEYARIIRKHGGRSNAFTSHDATAYHATMSRDTIGIAIELEADRMVNTRFEDKYFIPEKKVVQEERRMRVDRPRAALAQITNTVTYARTPLPPPHHRLARGRAADDPGGHEGVLPDLLLAQQRLHRGGGGLRQRGDPGEGP